MTAAQPRPAVQPWARKNPKRIALLTAASLIPAALATAITLLVGIEPQVGMVAIFLPLQLLVIGFAAVRVSGGKGLKDAWLTVVVIFFSALVFILLLSVLQSVIVNGAATISPHFLYQNNRYVSTTTSLEYGGVGHAILGSLLVVALTTVMAVPLGLFMGVYLTTSQSKLRSLVRSFTQALSGLPSVVSGLFILAAMAFFGFQPTGLTGALALFPLMLPTVARVAEESLRLVPTDLRWAALGLGAPTYRAFFQVVLPAAKTGIITAILLGIARIIGETAPLILTMSTNNQTNLNPLSGAMSTLPTFIYGFLNAGYASSIARAWGAAFVMLALVAIIFISARVISRNKTKVKSTKRVS